MVLHPAAPCCTLLHPSRACALDAALDPLPHTFARQQCIDTTTQQAPMRHEATRSRDCLSFLSFLSFLSLTAQRALATLAYR
jgi:hypothetical protein